MSKSDISDDFGEKRYKQLSFYDFDEDQKHLWNNDTQSGSHQATSLHGTVNYDDSDSDIMSDHLAVDEGAVEVLSVDEIRRMK